MPDDITYSHDEMMLAQGKLTIDYDLTQTVPSQLSVNMIGNLTLNGVPIQTISTTLIQSAPQLFAINFDTSALSPGLYTLNLQPTSGNGVIFVIPLRWIC